MKESIMSLNERNPSGLLEVKEPLTISQYHDNCGFNLKKSYPLYQSKVIQSRAKDWFSIPERTLENLFKVQKEPKRDLLIVYIIEVRKGDEVYCYLVLSDKAYHEVLSDESQQILQVQQICSKFLFMQENLVLK